MTLTTTEPTTIDITARSFEATRDLCKTLGIPFPKTTELKYLSVALVEIAIKEVANNPLVAQDIVNLYQSLMPTKSPKNNAQKSRETKPREKSNSGKHYGLPPGIKPIKIIDMSRFNPYAPPDPFLLREAFGDEQLPLIFQNFSLATLKEISALIEAKNPGSHPLNKSKKESVLAYILEYVQR